MTLVLASEDKETAEDWKGAIEAQIRYGASDEGGRREAREGGTAGLT